MDSMNLEWFLGVDKFFVLNAVEFIDLPLIITMVQDLCAIEDMPAQVRAVT